MKMTETLANQLFDTLACIAISANGGAPYDADGNLLMTDEHFAKIKEYAVSKGEEVLGEWEELMGEEWEIVEADYPDPAGEYDYDDADLECGFDPYEGCYSYDC